MTGVIPLPAATRITSASSSCTVKFPLGGSNRSESPCLAFRLSQSEAYPSLIFFTVIVVPLPGGLDNE